MVNHFYSLAFVAKLSILDVCGGSDYMSRFKQNSENWRIANISRRSQMFAAFSPQRYFKRDSPAEVFSMNLYRTLPLTACSANNLRLLEVGL